MNRLLKFALLPLLLGLVLAGPVQADDGIRVQVGYGVEHWPGYRFNLDYWLPGRAFGHRSHYLDRHYYRGEHRHHRHWRDGHRGREHWRAWRHEDRFDRGGRHRDREERSRNERERRH